MFNHLLVNNLLFSPLDIFFPIAKELYIFARDIYYFYQNNKYEINAVYNLLLELYQLLLNNNSSLFVYFEFKKNGELSKSLAEETILSAAPHLLTQWYWLTCTNIYTKANYNIFYSYESFYFLLCFIFFCISIFIYMSNQIFYMNKNLYLNVFKISYIFACFVLVATLYLYASTWLTPYVVRLYFVYAHLPENCISCDKTIAENFLLTWLGKTTSINTNLLQYQFYHTFINTQPILFIKGTICFYALLILVNTKKILCEDFQLPFGFIYLFLFYIGCLLILPSVNDFLVFYILLEIISLASYLLLAINRDKNNPLLAIEAAIKYLIMGSITIAFFLLGVSFLYFFMGTIEFSSLQRLMKYYVVHYWDSNHMLLNKHLLFTDHMPFDYSYIVYLGLFFIFAILFFKLGVVPFHNWSIDVYTASSFFVFFIFMVLPKLPLAFILLKFAALFQLGFSMVSNVFLFLGFCSILLGLFGGFFQTNIQRLFAYSAIVNVGFYIIASSLNYTQAQALSFFFFYVYTMTNVAFFVTMIPYLNSNINLLNVQTFFKKFTSTNPVLYLYTITALFSLAGLPPLWGFWGKILIIFLFVQQNLYVTAFFLLMATSALTFFYINIIKEIAFSKNAFDTLTPSITPIQAHYLTLFFFINLLGFYNLF